MKKFLSKKYLTPLFLLGAFVFFTPVIFYNIFDCYSNETFVCSRNFQQITTLFGIFFITSLFSLITYKMRDEVFEHWIKFAIWAVPVIMVLTYLIMGGGQNGLGIESAYGNSFDALLFILLYGIFIGISIYRIVSKYKQLKHR